LNVVYQKKILLLCFGFIWYLAFSISGCATQKESEHVVEDDTLESFTSDVDFLLKRMEIPLNASEFYNRGLLNFNAGNYDAAIIDYSRAIEIDPNDSAFFYNRGLAYYKKGENEAAIDNYNKALEIDPNNVDAFNSRETIYQKLEEVE
jgi:tetratricopeptide (TPR) repeat protein